MSITKAELDNRSIIIRDETTPRKNTTYRVGSLFLDMLNFLYDKINGYFPLSGSNIANSAVTPEKLSQAYFTDTEGKALQLSVSDLAQDLLDENLSRLEAEGVLLDSIASLVEALGESASEIAALKKDIADLQKQLDW
ncbi:MAG: hypothetical protein LBL57_04905 [Tannerella sp.]|jgi:hypothetical protein|nr:hypothetical protein [Tannerella sp.]